MKAKKTISFKVFYPGMDEKVMLRCAMTSSFDYCFKYNLYH